MDSNNHKSEEQLSSEQRTAILRVRALLAQGQGGSGWDAAWKEGATPWDAGMSQPALRQVFETSIASDLSLPKSGKALVPGCGRGYDVIYLASQGYEVLGADLSSTAINQAKEFLASQPQFASMKIGYQVLDFFQSPVLADQAFDIIYDYT
ncbi:hypothetical protein FRC10_009345 [Ceratobasidium sp. 414]|nr:hypothetical protein FRC10_009345 [Ceratobasidium sp. 414]